MPSGGDKAMKEKLLLFLIMKTGIITIILICFISCTGNQKEQNIDTTTDTVNAVNKMPAEKPDVKEEQKKSDTTAILKKEVPASKVYFNKRFKDVTVKNQGNNKFLVKGKGQIFEASFNWVIEDGHNELQKGYVTTDAGAPEWGNFSFTVNAVKKRKNSTLHLILFESSAKDGSRQYELPVLLY